MSTQDFDGIVSSAQPTRSERGEISWKRYGVYKATIIVRDFCFGMPKTKKRNNRFQATAETLISTLPDDANPFLVETSERLLDLHRTIENTEARRRLEKWARNTIILYLICVFLLVIANGVSRIIWSDIFKESGFISDFVMNVILSTTTINIIGLGVLVLKGHFPQKESKDKKKNESSPTSSQS
jgi:hypothetical protein